MLTSVATASGLSSWLIPPCPEYSPSLFARMMIQSKSPTAHPSNGLLVPGKMQRYNDDPTRTPPTFSTVRHAYSVIALGEDP